MGLGIDSENSRSRVPSPPQNNTTFMPTASSAQNLDLGNGDHQSGSPGARVGELGGDLVLQVPRENHDVVGFGLGDLLGWVDRDTCAGQEHAMFERIAVDGVVDEIGTDATVVQQGVPFPRCTIPNDLLALTASADEELA